MLTKAKREAAEMENALRKGTLHETADIEKGLQTMCLNIRSRFLSLPAKLAPAIAAKKYSQAEIFDFLKQAVDETLEELSKYQTILSLEGDAEESEEKNH